MIILDTNVISALMQQQPDPLVVAWLDDQPAESMSITMSRIMTDQNLSLSDSFHIMPMNNSQDAVAPI